MDINTNTQQYQPIGTTPVSIVPVKLENDRKPVDSSGSAGVSVVAEAKKVEHSERDLQQAVTKLNDFAQTIQRNLLFSLDKESGKLITKVVDSKTNEVIRQIPNEETVALARNLAALGGHEAEFKIFSSTA